MAICRQRKNKHCLAQVSLRQAYKKTGIMLAFVLLAAACVSSVIALADTAELDHILITRGFIVGNGGLSLLHPTWQTPPTASTLCSYPGIVCDVDDRVVVIAMTDWWIDPAVQVGWDIGDGTRFAFPFFYVFTRLNSFVMTITRDSHGVLPGSGTLASPAECTDIFTGRTDLPVGLVNYFIVGDEFAPAGTNVTVTQDFFDEMLFQGRCYSQLEFLGISDMPELDGSYGNGTVNSCIDVPEFIVVNAPKLRGEDVCFSSNSVTFRASNTDLRFLNEFRFCDNDMNPDFLLIVNTSLSVVPRCIISECQQVGRSYIIRENDICVIGQNITDDVVITADEYPFEVRNIMVSEGVGFSDGQSCIIERDNTECVGCDGVEAEFEPDRAVVDDCGVCGGTNDCMDCTGEPGLLVYDICDVCGGDGESCRDCFRVPFGTSRYDECDVCDGDGQSCLDCASTPFGTAEYDACDVCNGDNSTCVDCTGTPFGTAEYDRCGVCCGGDECVDCMGIVGGSMEVDRCGVCGGTNACAPCKDKERDACGVCFGDCSTCLDCHGQLFGTATVDACGVCGGLNDCKDCAGQVAGTAEYDECDVCGGDNQSCAGCDGLPNGQTYDVCGVCGGANECLDCAGVVCGLAVYDECDVCDGDGESCLDCHGTRSGHFARNRCGQCVDVRESPDLGDCSADILGEDLHDALVEWMLLGLLSAVLMFLLAAVCMSRFGIAWLICCRRFWRPTGRREVIDVRSEARESKKAVPVKRTGGGGGMSTAKLAVFGIALLCDTVRAMPQTPAERLFIELCEHTTLRNERACSFYLQFGDISSVCDSNFGRAEGDSPVAECYEDAPGMVRRVLLDNVPTLSGVITNVAWEQMRHAETIRIAHKMPREEDDDDGNFGDYLQLPAFALGDTAFELFTELQELRLVGVEVGNVGLPSSLAFAGKLTKIELIDIVDLVGDFSEDDTLCSLPLLKTLRIRGTGIGGSPVCGRYKSAWRCLVELDVRNNKLDGGLPDLALLENLKSILADNNQLSGPPPLPTELPLELRELCLAYNELQGELLGDWTLLEDLETFFVDGNRLFGGVPVFDFDGLTKLGLSFNNFSGPLPEEMATDAGAMYEEIRVQGNQIEAPWPPFFDHQLCGECEFDCNSVCEFPDPIPPTICSSCPLDEVAEDCGFVGSTSVPGFCSLNVALNTTFCAYLTGELSQMECEVQFFDGCSDFTSESFVPCQCGFVKEPCGCVGKIGGAEFDEDVFAICETPELPGVDVERTFKQSQCSYDVKPPACNGTCGDVSCLGCDGIADSGLVRDACGVCGGANVTCTDCAMVLHGTSELDLCGVCGGDDSSCMDCTGCVHGTAVYDACDVCGGDGSSCADCLGVPLGSAEYDACGVCAGNSDSCRDCHGIVGGNARFDEFGVCEGDGSRPEGAPADDSVLVRDLDALESTEWIAWAGAMFALTISLFCCAFAALASCGKFNDVLGVRSAKDS